MISKNQLYKKTSTDRDNSSSKTASKEELSMTETETNSFFDSHQILDLTPKIRAVSNFFNLLAALEAVFNRRYNLAFKSLSLYADQNLLPKASPRFSKKILSLYNKRQIFLKCIKKIIFFGRANLTQKIFWRWRFLLPSKPFKSIESMKRHPLSTLRALWNRFLNRKLLNCYKSFSDWKYILLNSRETLKASEVLSNFRKANEKSVKIAFCFLDKLFLSVVQQYFNNLLAYKTPDTKMQTRLLNIAFKKRLLSYFTIWAGQLEYVYDEQYEEIVTSTKKKQFEMVPKPCVEFLYYDTSTYDPAFRAVFRSLGHFIKQRMSFCLSTWKSLYLQKFQCSIESLPTNVSVDYNSYKLSPDNAEKLKHLVIHLYFINQKTLEMPNLTLLKWSQCATIRDLKVHKIKEMLMHNKKKHERKRKAFSKMNYCLNRIMEFTDLY